MEILTSACADYLDWKLPRLGMRKRPDWFREDLSVLFNLLVHQKIKPVIAARLSH